MNKQLILLLICFLFSALCCEAQKPLKQKQKEFDDALEEFYKKAKKIKFTEKTTNRVEKPIMRRSTEEGKILDELYKFMNEFARNQSEDTSKRQSPEVLSKEPGITISPSYCPFTRPISCDPTNKFRCHIISY